MSTRHSQPPQLETLPGMDASATIALAQSGAGELTGEQEAAVSRRLESLAVSAAVLEKGETEGMDNAGLRSA